MGSDVFGDEVEHHKVLDNVKSHKKKNDSKSTNMNKWKTKS